MIPTASSPPRAELRAAFKALRPYVMRAWFFSLVSGLLVLAPAWYMLEVYERVVNSRSHLTLALLTLLVLLAFAVMEALEWARAEIMLSAGRGLDRRLGARVFGAAFEAGRKRLVGGGMQAVQDLATLRDFTYSPALLATMEAPVSVVFLVLIFLINPWLGVVALVAACLQVFLGLVNQRSTNEPLKAANRISYTAQLHADRMMLNTPVIASMGMVGPLFRRWNTKHREAVSLQAQASRSGGLTQALSRSLQNIITSALLGLSCWLFLHDRLNGGAGMLIVAGIFGGRLLAPFIQVITQWQSVAAARDAWSRLHLLLEALPQSASAMPLPAPAGAVLVDNVTASAPGGQVAILKGISFALRPGEVVVVMGPSASGKTSLARLLLGLWPATSGKVRLDGVDVFGWDKNELGPHLGYLPQGVDLLEGTLGDNIARLGPADPAARQAAVIAVGLGEFVASLPQGLDTWLGPNGCTLSGGQRQRVALARAIYGNPSLLVLDEPNASLDEAGDRALAEVIAACKLRGCTVVVMSHRASVLAVADKVLLLREGQQQAFGPRDEVLAAIQQANAKVREANAQRAAPPHLAAVAVKG